MAHVSVALTQIELPSKDESKTTMESQKKQKICIARRLRTSILKTGRMLSVALHSEHAIEARYFLRPFSFSFLF